MVNFDLIFFEKNIGFCFLFFAIIFGFFPNIIINLLFNLVLNF